MREVALFCEDSFHERFVCALVNRFSTEHGVRTDTKPYSARGGLPKMHGELKRFLHDLKRGYRPLPELVIVVADANCLGVNERRTLLSRVVAQTPQFESVVEFAIPDPHIERWMLVDPRGFQAVFQRGCTLPAVKCKKDEYKRLLRSELRKCDIDPPLGGEEYAEDIVRAMDFSSVEVREPSLGLFLKALRARFNRWAA